MLGPICTLFLSLYLSVSLSLYFVFLVDGSGDGWCRQLSQNIWLDVDGGLAMIYKCCRGDLNFLC